MKPISGLGSAVSASIEIWGPSLTLVPCAQQEQMLHGPNIPLAGGANKVSARRLGAESSRPLFGPISVAPRGQGEKIVYPKRVKVQTEALTGWWCHWGREVQSSHKMVDPMAKATDEKMTIYKASAGCCSALTIAETETDIRKNAANNLAARRNGLMLA